MRSFTTNEFDGVCTQFSVGIVQNTRSILGDGQNRSSLGIALVLGTEAVRAARTAKAITSAMRKCRCQN